MNRRVYSILAIALLSGIVSTSASAQIMIRSRSGDSTRTIRLKADDVMVFPEVGGLILTHGRDLRVERVQPPDNRIAAYKGVDLREGDLLVLFNGERVKTILALNKAYEALPVGSTLKLGLQRDTQLLNVSFVKADPKDLPNIRIQKRTK